MYAIILALALQAQILFAANGLPCDGNVCVSYYENISGASVAHLKSAAKFPNSPDSVVSLTSLDVEQSRTGVNDNIGRDNFGVMLQAWIRAPQTSQYTFSTLSDDASEVWVHPVAAQKGNETDMVKVVELTGCCQKITGTTEISMEEGKSYYLLAYMKEAIGRDYLTIGMTAKSNNVEYDPISAQDNALGFAASTKYTKQTEDEFCKVDNGETWVSGTGSLAACQALCTAEPTCVAMSWWAELSECMLSPVCDEFQISYSNAVVYFKVEGADPAPAPPAVQGCVSGDSEFTQKTLLKLDQAQEKFGECADSVWSISTTVGRLSTVATVVDSATDTLSTIIEKVNDVTDKVLKNPPQGMGLANILGKVPKVGIFIKMGLKAVEKVIDGLDPLAETISNHADRIKSAVGVTNKVFLGMKVASAPTSLYLKGSHKILEAAHSCGTATGYQCGTSSSWMEFKNKQEYPVYSEQLDAIREVGVTCQAVLNPMDVILKELARIGEAIVDYLMAPLVQLLEAVQRVVDYLDEQITKLVNALEESEELQCALEIFEPVTDVINLVTCPVDEVVGFVMHEIIDVMMGSLNELINTAVILGVNTAVEALIPDDLYVYIPDFTAIIPTQVWIDTCDVAAVAFPEYATTVGTITNIDLPKLYSGRDIKDEILGTALEDHFTGMVLRAMEGGYESACKEAWEEMGTDFDNCEKVIEKITDALMDATCAASEAALAVEIDLLDAQQAVYNVARGHFEDAQKTFAEAQEDLADAYNDLDSAYDSVVAEKANCPSCRCGGCASGDINCHLEGVWCCPARHSCLAAFAVAEGAIELSMEVVDLAGDIAWEAQKAYSQAATGLTKETEKLKHQQARTQREAQAQALVCATQGTVTPITIDTAAPLPPCKCLDSWDSEECGLGIFHNGCPATPCDNDPKGTWCVTEPGCAEEESTYDGGWFYCGDEALPPLPEPIEFKPPTSNDDCMFDISVAGLKYGAYGPFTHVDKCDATFTSPSEADNASNGFNCGSRFGLQTSVLRSSTGKTVGILSCANQGFDITINSKTSAEYTSESGVYCFIKNDNVVKFDNAPNAQACKEKCTLDASCDSVSYWSGHGSCYLFSDCDTTSVSETGAVTYRKKAVQGRRLEMLRELPAPSMA